MSIDVFVADEQSARPVELDRWARLAEAVLKAEEVRGDVEVSLLFVDEEAIARLNQRFLGRSGPTDVLAFPIEDEPPTGGRSPDAGGSGPGWVPSEPEDLPLLLGDVVICPEVAWRQANGEGPGGDGEAARYEDELALLVVHGLLHLQGMDHEDEAEAEAMEARERHLLDRFHRRSGEAAPGPEAGGPGPEAGGSTPGTADQGPSVGGTGPSAGGPGPTPPARQ
jgi:probable rRNA maturation factor